MANVVMPQLGETVIEGTIVRWLKQEGESIALDEPLFEISTDKVDTEVPSPEAGVLERILVPEGQTVAVGTELAVIGSGTANEARQELSDEVPRMAAPAEAASSPAEAPQPPAPPLATGPLPTDGASPPAPVPPVPQPGATEPPTSSPGPVRANRGPRGAILSPVVRRLAREHAVDLDRVEGTGAGGRITRADVERTVAAGAPGTEPATIATAPREAPPAAPAAPAAAPTAEREEPTAEASADGDLKPLSHLRKAIASHMLESMQAAARAWTLVEVDVENIVRVRERVKQAFAEREGFKLTYMPFVTRAVTEALLEYPAVNSELRGEELFVPKHVHMGIAVSIEGGLIVPVIHEADAMNLAGLARAIDDLATRSREKRLLPDEVHGSTFSITNPGAFGSLTSVPIINQPNTAILSFDAIEKRPVVVDDAIAIRHRVYLSMSWDHRVIDGELATRFLARVKEHLETWDWDEDLDH